MSLEYTVTSLEGLDESVKGLYKENNGVFSLDVDLGDSYVSKSDVAGLKANHDKLLAEKKSAQAKANEAAQAAALAAEESAKKNGDLESLTKSWKEKENSYLDKINSFEQKEVKRIKDSAASDLALKLADGANAKLLQRFIADRLDVKDGSVQVLDKNGNLTVSTLEDLQKEFESSEDFGSLLRGSKASGSGASKGNEGGAGITEIKRADFDLMSQGERKEFFKSGGKVTD